MKLEDELEPILTDNRTGWLTTSNARKKIIELIQQWALEMVGEDESIRPLKSAEQVRIAKIVNERLQEIRERIRKSRI